MPTLVLAASGERVLLPFPALDVRVIDEAVDFDQDAEVRELLRHEQSVLLVGLPWDGGIDLELQRCRNPLQPGALHVDGRQVPDEQLRASTFWVGEVASEVDSDVFLGFTGGATWGWIRRSGELVHVRSQPGPEGGWRSSLVTERGLNARGSRFAARCSTPAMHRPQPPPALAPQRRPLPGGSAQSPRTLFGTLALETDWQFYQLFGDLGVAQGYVVALLAAADSRFDGQVGVALSTSYLGFHTTPADPWRTQEGTGNCIDLLYEFQDAWRDGSAPVPSDLHHFLSGAELGCGAGFIDALCDPVRGFSVTSHIDGQTPFPVGPHPLNWDFVWMCHELGHNFGTVHTHQYCPPLDECSPAGYFGPCQDEMACITQATIMSYCHACPGGMANFTTWFHPLVAQTMRAASEASCLQPFRAR